MRPIKRHIKKPEKRRRIHVLSEEEDT